MRKTKIVCTLGPACQNENILKELIKHGMNVARINFSHSNHEQQKVLIDTFKKVRDQFKTPIPLLLDTKGPEIRIGTFENGKVDLAEGQEFRITPNEVIGNEHIVSITYKQILEDVHQGMKILIDDGIIELVVVEITSSELVCKVNNGGTLSNQKNVHIPDAHISLPALTEKDIEDIKFGIEQDFDIVAASFVRKADDIYEIRKVLNNNGGSHITIIAKIENPQGVKNIDEIIRAADGIMVARGDLGVEIPIEEVPIIQKKLIEKCYKAGKPVITATQMLDSMIRNPRPTRAEATDIANAIYDGTSAIMLSGETAAGKYPVESLITMSKIAERAENSIDYKERLKHKKFEMGINVTNSISYATCTTAHDLGASAIITVTSSGNTARMVSKFRPDCPIIAATLNQRVQRQLNLSWGVIPLMAEKEYDTIEVFEHSVDIATDKGYVKNGDLVVITGGIPTGITGTTNALKVHVVGNVLVEGNGIGTGSATSVLCVGEDNEEVFKSFHNGNILAVKRTNDELIPLIKKSAGLIVEDSDETSHATTVGLALDIPVIVGARNATRILKQGVVVTMDSKRGLVYSGVTKV